MHPAECPRQLPLTLHQDEGDKYTRKIETERRAVDDLKAKVKEANALIFAKRKEMARASDTAARKARATGQRVQDALENRLNNVAQKHNKALAHAREIRERIDSLRRESVERKRVSTTLLADTATLVSRRKELLGLLKEAQVKEESIRTTISEVEQGMEQGKLDFKEKWKELGQVRRCACMHAFVRARAPATLHARLSWVSPRFVRQPHNTNPRLLRNNGTAALTTLSGSKRRSSMRTLRSSSRRFARR